MEFSSQLKQARKRILLARILEIKKEGGGGEGAKKFLRQNLTGARNLRGDTHMWKKKLELQGQCPCSITWLIAPVDR